MNRLPKHVTLKHLNAFVAVAQESSFTRAAERLFQTQSSVTSLVRAAGGSAVHPAVRAPAGACC